jgi:hypothetical protein
MTPSASLYAGLEQSCPFPRMTERHSARRGNPGRDGTVTTQVTTQNSSYFNGTPPTRPLTLPDLWRLSGPAHPSEAMTAFCRARQPKKNSRREKEKGLISRRPFWACRPDQFLTMPRRSPFLTQIGPRRVSAVHPSIAGGPTLIYWRYVPLLSYR